MASSESEASSLITEFVPPEKEESISASVKSEIVCEAVASNVSQVPDVGTAHDSNGIAKSPTAGSISPTAGSTSPTSALAPIFYCATCKQEFPSEAKYLKHVEFSTGHKEALRKLEDAEKERLKPKNVAPVSTLMLSQGTIEEEPPTPRDISAVESTFIQEAEHFFWRQDVRLTFQIFRLHKFDCYFTKATDPGSNSVVNNSSFYISKSVFDPLVDTSSVEAPLEEGGGVSPTGGELKSVIGGGELTKSSSASGSETMKLMNQGSFGKNRRRSSVSDEARKLKIMNDMLKSQKDMFFKALMDRMELTLSPPPEGSDIQTRNLAFVPKDTDPKNITILSPSKECITEAKLAMKVFQKRGGSSGVKPKFNATDLNAILSLTASQREMIAGEIKGSSSAPQKNYRSTIGTLLPEKSASKLIALTQSKIDELTVKDTPLDAAPLAVSSSATETTHGSFGSTLVGKARSLRNSLPSLK